MHWTFMAYHRADDNMLETCVHSLRRANGRAGIVIATDGVPEGVERSLAEECGVRWVHVPAEQMHRRRATCKIEALRAFVAGLPDGDIVLVSDVDVYFRGDPFVPASSSPEMHLAVTTRGYDYPFPINGGVFYLRLVPPTRAWLDWHLQEIYRPAWPPYVQHRKRFNHERYGLDWSVGQDFLVVTWQRREELLKERGLRVVDFGPRYNYCPPTDVHGPAAFDMVWAALEDGSDVVVVHLKSGLKKMIYDSRFPHAIIRHPKGRLSWL